MIDFSIVVRTAVTLAIATFGGTLFGLLGLPAGWLTGGMIAVAIAAMAKVPVAVPVAVRNVAFVVIGSFLGTSVSPELVSQLPHWPLSMAALVLNVFLVQWAAEVFLRRFCRWDRQTAFFAAIPGVTSYVIALALPTKADISRIAVSQTIRVFLLVLIMPNFLSAVGGAVAIRPQVIGSAFDVIATLAAGAVAGTLFSFVGIPAAPMIGAMVASGALHGAGWLHGGLPLFVQIPVYLALGAMIGSRFAGTSPRTLLAMLGPSFGSFAISIAIGLFGAWLTYLAVGLPFAQVLLAFAPGGIDVMTTVAFAMNLDSAFVAAHQLGRFIFITIYTPLVLARMGGSGQPPQTDEPA